MSHFAQIDENNIVIRVLVIEQDVIDSGAFGAPASFIKTSYNTRGGVHSQGGVPLRKNYAGIGDTYDPIRDAFYAAQPFPSWTLGEDECLWYAPTPKPDDGRQYRWDEPTLSWVLL